jgi:hypothetical protein
MPSFRYPLTPTSTGDLALTADPKRVALDRALLFVDCIKGDRKYQPAFGIEISLFTPETPQPIKDAHLQRGLIRWGGEGLKVKNGEVSFG